MSKFYRANDTIAAAVRNMYAAEEESKDKALKLSRKHGGSRVVVFTARGPYGDFNVIGFRFNTPPDPKHFVQIKGQRDGWRPRATGKGKKLQNQLKALRVDRLRGICGLLNMEMINHRMETQLPGIRDFGDAVYVEVPDDCTPPEDCIRISDLEMEQMLEGRMAEAR